MRRMFLPSRKVRRTPPKKSLGARQFFTHQLVDGLAVDGLTGQPGHRRLHHPAHVLRRGRAGFLDRVDDGLFDRGRIGGGRQIGFEHANLRLLLVRQLRPSALGELFDRILALLDQRRRRPAATRPRRARGRARFRGSSAPPSACAACSGAPRRACASRRRCWRSDRQREPTGYRPPGRRICDGDCPGDAGCPGGGGATMPGHRDAAVRRDRRRRRLTPRASAGRRAAACGIARLRHAAAACGFTTCGCGNVLNTGPRGGAAAAARSAPASRRRRRRPAAAAELRRRAERPAAAATGWPAAPARASA